MKSEGYEAHRRQALDLVGAAVAPMCLDAQRDHPVAVTDPLLPTRIPISKCGRSRRSGSGPCPVVEPSKWRQRTDRDAGCCYRRGAVTRYLSYFSKLRRLRVPMRRIAL